MLKISSFLLLFLFLSACSESPVVEFYSYHELMEYDFFSNGWFPGILKEDAFAIKETYDVNSRHVFGQFEFKQRDAYDAEIKTCQPLPADSLVEKIERPAFPKWFIQKKTIVKGQCLLVTHGDFYLIVEKNANRIYFFR